MKFDIFYFPIFAVTIVFFLFSCEKEIKSNEKNTFSTYTEKAQQFQDQVKFDSAFYYYTKAKNSLPEPTNEQLAFLSLQIATLQQHQGDYFGCEETVTEALKEYKGTLYLPYLYNILAVCYQKQHNFYQALRYYQNAFETATDSLSKAIFQNNIGLIYIENKQFKQAQTILENLISNKNIRENKFEFARVQDNLGYTQFQLKNKNAIDLLLNAKQLRDSLTDYIGLIASNMHLAEYYQNSDKETAKKYADFAYQSSLKANNPDDQLEALKWLSDFASPVEAKNYYKSYIQLNDSLVKARNSAKNQFSKIKYDSKKATQEVIKYKNQNLYLLLMIVGLLLISTLLYFLYQSFMKRQVVQSSYLTETRISKRIHDELANDVFKAMAFTQTKDLENNEHKESLLDLLETIYERTRDISKENNNIQTNEHFENDLLQMLTSFSNQTTSVILKSNNDINWSKILPEKKIALYRILQELLVNTKKHGQASLVVINFQNLPKTIQINYSDNGLGFDLATSIKNGLQNAEIRILALKGTLTFDSTIHKGFRAKLIIPK